MGRYRLAPAARADAAEILVHSEVTFGTLARRRYRALLEAVFRLVAEQPDRQGAIARPDLGEGYMEFHLRHCPRSVVAEGRVQRPRHALFYRVAGAGMIDILRILHDRMDPRRHMDNDN